MWFALSSERMRIAMASADVVKVMLMNLNNCTGVRRS